MRRLSDIVCNRNPLILEEIIPVKDACQRMREHQAGAVLVCDRDGRLTGIFTGRDAVRRVLAAGKSSKVKLKEAMTRDPVTMAPDKPAIEALRLMWDGGFRHLPLVENRRIVGVISRGDFGSEERLTLDEERLMWEQMR
ncbi:MAG TPA: CBS domain-containing protein [Rhizomicrobium sp.]|nr:CBS domain-containing protein [Rhizomicrobium sp.]